MSDPDETLSADEGEPGDQYTGGPHVQPRQPVSQAAVQDAIPMGVSNFTFDFDSGILLQDEDGLVGVSHHEQQLGLTEAGEGVADPLSGSTNDTRRRRLSKREQKVEKKEKTCQKFRDALAAWNAGRYVSVRQCADAFGVPRTSLNDMIREGRTESPVPSASDTSSKATKVRKRKGTMAPDGVASETPVPPKRLLRRTQGRRETEAGQDDT